MKMFPGNDKRPVFMEIPLDIEPIGVDLLDLTPVKVLVKDPHAMPPDPDDLPDDLGGDEDEDPTQEKEVVLNPETPDVVVNQQPEQEPQPQPPQPPPPPQPGEDGDPQPGEDGDPQEGDPQEGDPQEGDPQEGDSQDGDPQEGDSQDGASPDGGSQGGSIEDLIRKVAQSAATELRGI